MSEYDLVVAALRALKPSIRRSSDPAWETPPALRVIDCVLSLNRPYRKVVEPRRNRFASQHPHTKTVGDLHREIRRYPSAYDFLRQTLDTEDKDRAETLANVTAWLASIGGDGTEAEQLANIKAWAVGARFRDYRTLGIRGFGLSGFQYLRMLFGADTCKPDLRIRQWVSKAIGREVSFDKADKRNLVNDIRALDLLERATREMGLSLRDTDTTIWELITEARDREAKREPGTNEPGCRPAMSR